MSDGNQDEGESVEYSYNLKDGNYIGNIYYEFETNKAVLFERNLDEKGLWIPKSIIKGGWKKDKKIPQNVRINYPIPLYWKDHTNTYLELVG